jgi:hypothetical protein
MRKLAVAFLALALLLVGTLLPLVVPRRCPVNRAAFERMEVGMTQAEVLAILGGPPGDYLTRPNGWRRPHAKSLPPAVLAERWMGDEGDVSVVFTPGGVVADVQFDAVPPDDPGLLELALWRLERLKERLLP